MRAEHSHHFNLNPDFMARAAGNDGNRASKEKTTDSHYGKSEEELITGYKKNIAILREFTDKKPGSIQRENLEKFAELVEAGIKKDFTIDILASYKTVVFDDLSMVCKLATDTDLPEDIRKETIEELTTHLVACAPGMAQRIEEAARKLQVLKNGISHNFIHQLISVINAEIDDYIKSKNICKHIGNEIHYTAAFFDHIAPSFSLPPRSDPFAPNISDKYLNEFAQHLHEKAIIDRAIEVMAEDCRNQIIEFYAKDHPNLQSVPMEIEEYREVYIKFLNAVQPKIELAFGPILSTDIFSAFYENSEDENEKYRLTIDNSLLAHSIARNLRTVKSITFDADYLAGKKGPGAKLKISGEKTVYVSTTDNSKNHHHQILEEFIWQDASQAKELLDKLNNKATEKPEIKKVQNDILQRISLSAATRMVQSKDLAEFRKILTESMALIWSDTAKEILLATSMAHALGKKRPDIAEIILSTMGGQHLGNKDGDGNTVLHLALMNAIQEPHPQLTESISKKMSHQQLALQNKHGDTALMLALKRDDLQSIRILLNRIDPSQLSHRNRDGDTALMIALKHNNVAIATQLVERMTAQQLDLTDKAKHNALSIALHKKKDLVADAIVHKMSDESLIDRHQRLLKNLERNLFTLSGGKAIRFMLTQHLGLKNPRGETALMMTLRENQDDASLALIAKMTPEQLGICDKDGNTALMQALERGNTKIALALMEKMPTEQLEIRNKSGATAFIIAKDEKETEMCRRIVKKIDPPIPGFWTRIQLFFMNMISEQYQSDSTRAKLAKFYWY